MEFLQLKYFQHAAQTENLSHTAQRFIVPVSSVSVSIKRLESELGVTLFDRSANKISLNKNGKLFLDAVDDIFLKLESTKRLIQDNSEQLFGRINVLINSNRRILSKLIAQFQRLHPGVSFYLDFTENKSLTNYDVIISDSVLSSSEFESCSFIKEEILLAVHKDNPLSCYDSIPISMLKDMPFICMHKNHSLRSITDNLCSESGFRPHIAMECDDPHFIREYLKNNIGVSIVPAVSWRDQWDDSIILVRINGGIFRDTKIHLSKASSQLSHMFCTYLRTCYQAIDEQC